MAKVDPNATKSAVIGKAMSALGRAMAAPIRQRMGYAGLARKVFRIEQVSEPCPSCGRTDCEEGYKAGCMACTARSVMET